MTDPAEQKTGARANVHEFTVSELSFALKRDIEERFGYVRVRGELGRVSRPASGHVYLDLKDEKAVLAGVIWRGTAAGLKVKPEQGLEVICTGRLTTYPGQSKYQIVIERMEPAGVGALMALLEERKKKLAAEGLFDEARKKPIPYLPAVIGVVTSPTGAVIRDILHRLQDRFSRRVLIWPVRVQGEGAAGEIVTAIEGFNALPESGPVPRPDVLIVARGGGSLEDLWPFNEEIVARAAAASAIPLISAVGHETDTTLIDFASDRRAPTPTAAAEMAVPVRSELIAQVLDREARLVSALTRAIAFRRDRVKGLGRGLPRKSDVLALPRQRLDHLSQTLGRGLMRAAELKRAHFERQPDLGRLAVRTVAERRQRLQMLGARISLEPQRRRVAEAAARLLEKDAALGQAMARRAADARRRLETAAALLSSYSYERTLDRGFALVRDAAGEPVTASAGLGAGDPLQIEFSRSDRLGVVVAGEGIEAPKPGAKSKGKSKRPQPAGSKQGSLF